MAVQSVLRHIFRKDISGIPSAQNLTHANHAGHDKFLHVKKPKVHMLRFAGCSKARNYALANVAVSAEKMFDFWKSLESSTKERTKSASAIPEPIA